MLLLFTWLFISVDEEDVEDEEVDDDDDDDISGGGIWHLIGVDIETGFIVVILSLTDFCISQLLFLYNI